jgi:hypothetical protein
LDGCDNKKQEITMLRPLSITTTDFLAKNSQLSPGELDLQHQALAIFMDVHIKQKLNKPHTFVIAGSEDLRVLLSSLNFSQEGDEALILNRP